MSNLIKHASFIAAFWCAAILSTTTLAGANDRFTGLPVYPGVRDDQPQTESRTCGAYHVKLAIFYWDAAASDSALRIANWYMQRFPRAKLIRHSAGSVPNAQITEVRFADGSGRVEVIASGPRTVLKLTRVDPPIDFGKLMQRCS